MGAPKSSKSKSSILYSINLPFQFSETVTEFPVHELILRALDAFLYLFLVSLHIFFLSHHLICSANQRVDWLSFRNLVFILHRINIFVLLAMVWENEMFWKFFWFTYHFGILGWNGVHLLLDKLLLMFQSFVNFSIIEFLFTILVSRTISLRINWCPLNQLIILLIILACKRDQIIRHLRVLLQILKQFIGISSYNLFKIIAHTTILFFW